MQGKDILEIEMRPNDADAPTVRAYLKELLFMLWAEGEGFSGKRPFGNSGWESELLASLVAAGAVDGAFDEDGYMAHYDDARAHDLIIEAIKAL